MSSTPSPRRFQALGSAGTRAVALGLGLLMTAVVSRALTEPGDKSAIGAWSVIFTALFALATVARMGVDSLALKVTAQDPATGHVQGRGLLLISVFFGVIAAVPMALVVWSREAVQDGPDRVVLCLLVATLVVASNTAIVGGAWLRGLGNVTWAPLVELGLAPALTISAVAVRELTGTTTLPFVLVAYATASWITAIVMLGWGQRTLARRRDPARPLTAARVLWGEHWSSLVSFTTTALGFFLFTYLPVFLYGATGDDAAAADYRNAYTLAGLVLLVPTLQAGYLSPRFAALHGCGDAAGLADQIRRATIVAGAAATALGLPLIVWADDFLTLAFGSDYAAAATVLRILTAGGIVLAALGPVYPLLTMTGHEHTAQRLMALALIPSAVLMLLALGWGHPEVAIASVLGPVTFAVLGRVRFHQVSRDLTTRVGEAV